MSRFELKNNKKFPGKAEILSFSYFQGRKVSKFLSKKIWNLSILSLSSKNRKVVSSSFRKLEIFPYYLDISPHQSFVVMSCSNNEMPLLLHQLEFCKYILALNFHKALQSRSLGPSLRHHLGLEKHLEWMHDT